MKKTILSVLVAGMLAVSSPVTASVLYGNITISGGNPRALATIDTTTGLVTRIGEVFDTSNEMQGITYVSSMNALFGIALPYSGGPSNLFRIDLATGAQTLVGSTGVPRMSGLQFDPNSNQLFATSGVVAAGIGDPSLYTLNPLTGASTLVGSLGLPAGISGIEDLAFDSTTNTLYAATASGTSALPTNVNGLNVIDTGTGAATFVGLFQANITNFTLAMAFDAATSQLLGGKGGSPDHLTIINATTGAATFMQNLSIGSQNSSHVVSFAFVPSSAVGIPEPSTLAIFALGLAGLGFMRRRRAV